MECRLDVSIQSGLIRIGRHRGEGRGRMKELMGPTEEGESGTAVALLLISKVDLEFVQT